jgi:hypothetical protein
MLMCALALTSCTVLFDSEDSAAPEREEDQEVMVALEGDRSFEGLELYIGRTIDGVSFIESYDSSASPQSLTSPFVLPFVPTAMVGGKSNAPNLLLLGTGDTNGDGTREIEFFDRLNWGMEENVEVASHAGDFLRPVGPAIPGSSSFINGNVIAPGNPVHYSMGEGVTLLDAAAGWDNLNIDPTPWLNLGEPIRCYKAHDLGGAAHEIAAFAGSTVMLADINTQEAGQTIHNVVQRVQQMDFEMNACARVSGKDNPTYITTDGSALHAIGMSPDPIFLAEMALPEASAPHQNIVSLHVIRLADAGSQDLVLVVADPPTVYVGLDMAVNSGGLDFGVPVFAQAIDFIPSAALLLGTGANNTDRLYISEAKRRPRCFELGTDASGFKPELVPCVD